MPVQDKPLGHKAYPNIGHLPGSKLGKGDHYIAPGQAFLATGFDGTKYGKKGRAVMDPKILVVVQEKIDGSCCGVLRQNDEIIPIIRSGYRATSSPYEHIQMFARWVKINEDRFRAVLWEGERLMGEWLCQSHGLVYVLKHEPFVAFDLMRDGHERASHLEMSQRVWNVKDGFVMPGSVWVGESLSPTVGMMRLGEFGFHGCTEQPEGLIYRVEKEGKTLFVCKWVRGGFEAGKYLPKVSGKPPIWQYKL